MTAPVIGRDVARARSSASQPQHIRAVGLPGELAGMRIDADETAAGAELRAVPNSLGAGATGRQYWAFQVNPDVYDIERAVHDVPIDTWMTKRSDIQAGDHALMWKSLGRSTSQGIVSFAEILTDPAVLLPEHPEFWLKGDAQGAELRVKMRYVIPPNCPVWATPATEPMLSRLSVWGARGSIFRVTPEQWDDVVELAGRWPSPPGSEIQRSAESLNR